MDRITDQDVEEIGNELSTNYPAILPQSGKSPFSPNNLNCVFRYWQMYIGQKNLTPAHLVTPFRHSPFCCFTICFLAITFFPHTKFPAETIEVINPRYLVAIIFPTVRRCFWPITSSFFLTALSCWSRQGTLEPSLCCFCTLFSFAIDRPTFIFFLFRIF